MMPRRKSRSPARRIHPGLLPSLLALTVAACQPAEPAVDTAADEATVRQLAMDWAAAEASNDDGAAIAMMWEDAVMQPPGAPQVQGHGAIRELYAAVEFVSLEAGPLDVRVGGDLAAVWGPLSYTLTMAGDTMSDVGKFVAVWERRDGVWKVLENTWNSDAPPSSTVPAAQSP